MSCGLSDVSASSIESFRLLSDVLSSTLSKFKLCSSNKYVSNELNSLLGSKKKTILKRKRQPKYKQNQESSKMFLL